MSIRINVLFLVVSLTLISCKKKEKDSESDANNTYELSTTSEFFKNSWAEEFDVNLESLPKTGESEATPYSGFWYPEITGGTNNNRSPDGPATEGSSPLVKYDFAFNGGQRKAAYWERDNHAGKGTQWAGHCNGFSAAAVRHKEPIANVVRNGVTFTPEDIKALLAEIYMSADYMFLGGMRCESKYAASSPDYRPVSYLMDECEDVNPGTFHAAITNWIGKKKKAIVFDKSRDNQVWNYPLYKYNSYYREIGESEALKLIGSLKNEYVFNKGFQKLFHVSTTVTYSDALNNYEIAPHGSDAKTLDLQYILEIDAKGEIIGGEWAQFSRTTHPDFIWVPLEPLQGTDHRNYGNPNLEVNNILEIWAESAGYGSLDNAPPQLAGTSWSSNWGKFDGYEIFVDGGSRGAVYKTDENTLTIYRESGFPALSIELNGDSLTADTLTDTEQSFVFSPYEGINWFNISYVLSGQKKSEVSVFHVLR